MITDVELVLYGLRCACIPVAAWIVWRWWKTRSYRRFIARLRHDLGERCAQDETTDKQGEQ